MKNVIDYRVLVHIAREVDRLQDEFLELEDKTDEGDISEETKEKAAMTSMNLRHLDPIINAVLESSLDEEHKIECMNFIRFILAEGK